MTRYEQPLFVRSMIIILLQHCLSYDLGGATINRGG